MISKLESIARFTARYQCKWLLCNRINTFDNAGNLFCGIIIASTLVGVGAIRSARVIDYSNVSARISY